jgi:hypothetical protein
MESEYAKVLATVVPILRPVNEPWPVKIIIPVKDCMFALFLPSR